MCELLESIGENRGRAKRLRQLAQSFREDMKILATVSGSLHRAECERVRAHIQAAIDRCEEEAREADKAAEKVVKMLPVDGVLYAYYAVGVTWEEVAWQKDLSLRYVYRLRKKELQTFLNKITTERGEDDAL